MQNQTKARVSTNCVSGSFLEVNNYCMMGISWEFCLFHHFKTFHCVAMVKWTHGPERSYPSNHYLVAAAYFWSEVTGQEVGIHPGRVGKGDMWNECFGSADAERFVWSGVFHGSTWWMAQCDLFFSLSSISSSMIAELLILVMLRRHFHGETSEAKVALQCRVSSWPCCQRVHDLWFLL